MVACMEWALPVVSSECARGRVESVVQTKSGELTRNLLNPDWVFFLSL